MSLVEKYNISEKDAYTLAEIEILKDKEGLLSLKKEKLKAKSMQVLKPYKVKFMDLGNLIIEIKKNPHFNSPEMKEKYGKIESEDIKSDFSWTYKVLMGCLIVAAVIFFSRFNGPSKGDVDQNLTNIYSGEYKGRANNQSELFGFQTFYYEISVDPVKYVSRNEYEAYVSGKCTGGDGSVVSLAGGKLTITISEEINPKTGKVYPPSICLYDKNGSNIFGGDPCEPYYTEEIEAIKQEGDTVVYKNGAIVHDGFVFDRRENRFFREDLNNKDKDNW